MMNLLPREEKRQLQAARSNTLLLRYNIFLVGVIVFLGAGTGITYVFLNNTNTNAEAQISENQSKVSSYAAVQSQANEFRSNLTTAKQILDREVAYTKVILEISNALPAGIVLENLSLDSQTFGTETILVAHAKDYSRALALKDAFGKSPLFSNVHFQSITSADGGSANPGYPITINLGVTIKKDAAKS
jgi:Tfp pilus assembly protein PilN